MCWTGHWRRSKCLKYWRIENSGEQKEAQSNLILWRHLNFYDIIDSEVNVHVGKNVDGFG